MALPGLSLPGLGTPIQHGSQLGSIPAHSSSPQSQARTEELAPRAEWRFEVAFSQEYTIRLVSGQAEIFGVELAPNQTYSFSGSKAAVFTWHGCQLEIAGDAESEYLGSETEYAVEWLNFHGMLETARDDAAQGAQRVEGGPRVIVVGPEHVGKSSLLQSLAAWAVKTGRVPLVVNADPKQGMLAPPGSLSAIAVGSQMDVENGYGVAPISGQTVASVKTPLVYHYPYSSPSERPEIYKLVTTRMAVSVTSKLEEDPETKQAGLIIDTPGSLNDPKSSYALLAHLISEFSITCILAMGSERLFNDLNRRFGQSQEPIPVLRISKPGGAVERDSAFTKQILARQIRQYFYGTPKEPLNPHSQTHPFAELAVYRANSDQPSSSTNPSTSTMPNVDDDEDDYDPSSSSKPSGASKSDLLFERITPSQALLNGVLAIKFCQGNSAEETIRDSAVMGFLYVSEVDETKQRVRFLAPGPQRWGDRALVWGPWPEAVVEGIST